jgi:hypothetical protein
MSLVAPKGRKQLSADALFRLVRSGFANILDHRSTDVEISFTDALMSAFAMFSLTSPSLLAFDNQRAAGNLGTIYGIEHAPCDTQMREILDPVSPESLRPVFKSVFRQLQRGKALEPMAFLDDHSLLCLDGTVAQWCFYDPHMQEEAQGCYVCCSASIKQISPSPSSKHSPQINRASGFAHAFCPQSGQVNFILLDFLALACLSTGADCQ